MGSSDPTQLNNSSPCPRSSLSLPVLPFLAVVSAESKPRYHKLEKLGCSLDQVILCAGEIEAAWNNCWDSADIQGCIAGIVGASDCGLCICDVLGWLGLMEC